MVTALHCVAYQKLLSWEPLLELVKMEVVEKKETYSTEDTVQLDLVIRMHGPKVS